MEGARATLRSSSVWYRASVSEAGLEVGGDVRQLPSGDWFVRGHVPVADLADYGIALPGDSDDYNSIGGLVFNDLGRLPKRGDKVDVDGYELRVESVRENRIEAVRIRHRPKPPEPAPTETTA